MTLLSWGIITLLILVNALYVAAEFAAVSVSRSRVQQRAEQGNALARQLMPVLENAAALDRYIAACQIGITLSSLVLGAYGQATLATALVPVFQGLGGMQEVAAQTTAAIVVLVGLTVFQMILGELVPKSLALQYPTAIALWTVVPMRWSLWLLSWFIALLNGSGIALLRLFGVREIGHRHIHSPDEIELLIAESREGGLLEPDEHRRLRKALQLGIRRVSEIMVPRTRIQALDVRVPAHEVLRVVTESPYTRLPIYEGTIDRIVGVVHVQDVAVRAGRADGGRFSLRDIARPVMLIPESMTAEQLLTRFREERRQIAVVADEFGGTAGLITVDDVLEEVMGDVADEFKTSEIEVEVLGDGRVRLSGDLRLEEAASLIGIDWDGEAATVGGWVVS
ncbi:MAG: hemolysin family protein, partial [Gemmatimonadota bacterium]|nr:hemolysin family protein [Gemmatimonadota bacterium]